MDNTGKRKRIIADRLREACQFAEPFEWTDDRNARRFALINRKIQGALTEEEKKELERLQQALRRHVNLAAPLPFDAARRLHAKLLKK